MNVAAVLLNAFRCLPKHSRFCKRSVAALVVCFIFLFDFILLSFVFIGVSAISQARSSNLAD